MITTGRKYKKPRISTARPFNATPLVPGAEWRAGVTRDHHQFRPFLNGEPLPLCFAANERLGWAKVYVPAGNNGNIGRDSLDVPHSKTLHGYVELRRCIEQDFQ